MPPLPPPLATKLWQLSHRIQITRRRRTTGHAIAVAAASLPASARFPDVQENLSHSDIYPRI